MTAHSPRIQREVKLLRITHAGEAVRCWRTTPYTGRCVAALQRVETECVAHPRVTHVIDMYTRCPHPDDGPPRRPRTQRVLKLSRGDRHGQRTRRWRTTPYASDKNQRSHMRVETEFLTSPYAKHAEDLYVYNEHPDDDSPHCGHAW